MGAGVGIGSRPPASSSRAFLCFGTAGADLGGKKITQQQTKKIRLDRYGVYPSLGAQEMKNRSALLFFVLFNCADLPPRLPVMAPVFG